MPAGLDPRVLKGVEQRLIGLQQVYAELCLSCLHVFMTRSHVKKYILYYYHSHSYLTHLCLVNSLTSLYGCAHFQCKGCLVCTVVLQFIIEIPVPAANSVEPDQTPHFAESDLGLHCLPIVQFMES